MDLLVFDGFPESLDKHIAAPAAFAIDEVSQQIQIHRGAKPEIPYCVPLPGSKWT